MKTLFIALVLVLLPFQAFSASPTIRNSNAWGLFESPSVNTLPQPLLGDVIVVFVVQTASITTPPTDSAGNTYVLVAHIGDANGNWTNGFTAPVTITGSGTLTISTAGGGSTLAADVTGVASTTADGSGTGTYSGSAGGLLSASSITTTAPDLILSAAYDQNGVALTVNTGTLISTGSPGGDTAIAQQRTTSSAGSFTESFNVPASGSETASIVSIAIKGSGGGGGPPASQFFMGASFGKPAPRHPTPTANNVVAYFSRRGHRSFDETLGL